MLKQLPRIENQVETNMEDEIETAMKKDMHVLNESGRLG